MRQLKRLAGFGALALAVPVLLAACSSSAATNAAGSQTTAKSTAAPVTPLTGTQLKQALLTVMPPGFKLDKPWSMDTGTDMQKEKNGAPKSASHCADLNALGWIDASGMSGVSFAQSDYVDGHDQQIAQEIDSFDTPADAARALSQLKAFMLKCKTYTDTSDGTAYHLAVSTVKGLGTAAIEGVFTSSSVIGGLVEIASLSGDNVVTAFYSARSLTAAKTIKAMVAKINSNLAAK